MRIFAALVLLTLPAACTAPPQAGAPGTAPTASAIAAFLGPPAPAPAMAPQPVALVPTSAPSPAVPGPLPAPPVWYSPSGYTWVGPVPVPFSWWGAPEPGGRLTLNNFSDDEAKVQVVLTNRPDCAAADPAATGDFVMPLNATRVIPTPPGFDICWRRETPPAGSARVAREAVPGWADWNRAYTASGRYIDMRL